MAFLGSSNPIFSYFLVLSATGAIVTLILLPHMHFGKTLQAGPFSYEAKPSTFCNTLRGTAADHVEGNVGGLKYTVTTPTNYRPDYKHPLIVVWPPSLFGARLNERFTGLTHSATTKGYVIAYVTSQRLTVQAILAAEAVPRQIIDQWCIDESAIFYTGHSNGGTITNALALLPGATLQPLAIAPSALGMNAHDLSSYSCPAATSAMIMHGKSDTHFPNYGSEAAQWWASCNGCSSVNRTDRANGCVAYSDCDSDTKLYYCEIDAGHYYWPGEEFSPIDFFHDVLKQHRLNASKDQSATEAD